MQELLNSVTWHHLAFIFAVIFILVFHKPLSNLIVRTTKIGREGLTAEASPESQREIKETNAEAVQHLLDVVGNSIVINEKEDTIKSELTSKQLSAESDTAKVLIKHLAGTQLLLAFEKIHSLIFGSQLFLLKKLNEVAGQGRTVDYVNDHVEHVKKLYPEVLGNWTFEQYLEYLYSQSLITVNKQQIHITNLGVEYLIWITRNGRKDDNPL